MHFEIQDEIHFLINIPISLYTTLIEEVIPDVGRYLGIAFRAVANYGKGADVICLSRHGNTYFLVRSVIGIRV